MAWNCQVQHILASASPSGRASIWDLRKNDLIIKVSDHSNRVRHHVLFYTCHAQPLVGAVRLANRTFIHTLLSFFSQMHCSGLAWNPDVATQLIVASEDDRMPVIQMWDLRFATSPLKVLENHTR